MCAFCLVAMVLAWCHTGHTQPMKLVSRTRETRVVDALPPAQPLGTLDPWRDMSGDARTTKQHQLHGGGLPQCSLSTVRNLFREQSYSETELASHSLDHTGDISTVSWEKVLEPLRQTSEVFRCFDVSRVSSQLLADVRLAARFRVGSTHVTALLRVEASRATSFRHYDNDSEHRQRGVCESLSMRGLVGNFMLWALLPEDSPLCQAVDALHVDRVQLYA